MNFADYVLIGLGFLLMIGLARLLGRDNKKRGTKSNNGEMTFLLRGTIALKYWPYAVAMGLIYFFVKQILPQNSVFNTVLPIIFFTIIVYLKTLSYKEREEKYGREYLPLISKDGWILVFAGAFCIFILYTYTQCQAFNMNWGLDCVLKTFGK